MIANMLKSLIEHERIETTITKAKELRRHADYLITLAKKNTLATKRRAIADLMIRYNTLTPKDQRAVKKGSLNSYNADRLVINKLFQVLGARFVSRQGGYTRIVKNDFRVGDNAATCFIEYLQQ
jgi:large subunit ribosomal protein L17